MTAVPTGTDRPSPAAKDRSQSSPPASIAVVVIVSAALAASSGASPVGLRSADIVWCALLGAAAPLAASRSSRPALLITGGAAAIIGISGDSIGIAAALLLLGALVVTALAPQPSQFLGSCIGGLSIQALVHGPSYGTFGVPTLIGAAALVPIFWSTARWAIGRNRRRTTTLLAIFAAFLLVPIIALGIATVIARSTLLRATTNASSGLEFVTKGDTEQATAAFKRSSKQFADASSLLGSVFTWTGRFLPIAAQNLHALQVASTAGDELAETAANTASSADYRSLTMQSGQVDLDHIKSLGQPVRQSINAIDKAMESIDQVDSAWLVPMVNDQFRSLRTRLANTRDEADLAAEGIDAAPSLFGGDTPKTYFLSFGSPGESRNGGGFVGAYAILRADKGQFSLSDSGPISDLYPAKPPGYAFDPPPDWQSRYGLYNVNFNLGNHSASPSWPVDAGVIGQLYPQSRHGTHIDGAVYADPAALAGLLEITGPISVPGISRELDAENVEQYLLRDQYIEFAQDQNGRKDVLGDVARSTFAALTSRPLPNLATLTSVLGPLVAVGHLHVSSFDAAAETFLDHAGISGAWVTEPGSDYLSVRSADLLTNKIDAFLHRSIDVQTRIDGDTVRSTVTVEMRNDAPPSGLPPYLIGNSSGLPDGTSRTIVTVYSPLALDSVTINGSPTGAQVQQEFGGPTYGVVAEIPAGSTITIRYELVGPVPSRPYRLEVIPQAMANPDHLLVGTGTGASGALRTRYDGVLDHIVNISPIAVS
jgi:hypothetical protein